jgi:hypothetical protein
MAAQVAPNPGAAIIVSPNFKIRSQDARLEPRKKEQVDAAKQEPPLGPLTNFTGTFVGTGFNTIFRPNSGPPNGTTFINAVSPPPPTTPSENTLELNLTVETLAFSNPIGSVPNRGLEGQQDIFLNGVPYVQTINDVTNPETGKADGNPSGIHFEPGVWMHVPATTVNPVVGESLARMASIPHGTTINAQSFAPTASFAGPPKFLPVDITPFLIGTTTLIPFAAQKVSDTDTPRLPQDLTKFIAAGTITQDMLTDPNTVLRNAIKEQTITNTTVFTVSTMQPSPELGGGTTNIAFLLGSTTGTQSGPNADAVQMMATFWIEQVEHKIQVPVCKPGQPVTIPAPAPQPGVPVPTFVVDPPKPITEPKTITVSSTQIQYSQIVLLNFNGLTWPHVSVATVVPEKPLPVPASALG